jgi:Lon protease-like protein
MNDDKAALQEFSGTARLFPLPNLVFFPHALQPLHIFEPRYRQMTADALAGDRLISPVLLQPGWEKHYEKKPPLYPIACLGRIVAEEALDDGRFNLLLRGIGRIRILEEIPTATKLYRSANVELIEDRCGASLTAVMDLRRQLEEKILPRFGDTAIVKQLSDLFHSELRLGTLCDVLTFALPVPIEWKQMMLEEANEDLRANMLLEGFDMIAPQNLRIVGSPGRKFPPDFSSN